jgi:NAD(P)-dependent dehydrogenase (short-subunit alcohol dehydrogenase family)
LHRIDILVHLVGAFAGGAPVSETDDATLDRMLDLNFRSAFYVIRAVIPFMRAAGQGRIIAIGSRAAIEPQPTIAAYSASKAALVSLIQSAAKENKDRGITANVILAGTMDTPPTARPIPALTFHNGLIHSRLQIWRCGWLPKVLRRSAAQPFLSMEEMCDAGRCTSRAHPKLENFVAVEIGPGVPAPTSVTQNV